VRLGRYAKMLRERALTAYKKSGKDIIEVHYTEIAVLLDCSPSKAFQIARQLSALFEDFEYKNGILRIYVNVPTKDDKKLEQVAEVRRG